ncbi:hypothetical protein [Streptomyces sviceus]
MTARCGCCPRVATVCSPTGTRAYGAAALGGSGHGAHFGAVIDE